MKYLLIAFLFISLSSRLQAQQESRYKFTSRKLIEKPQPSREFVQWIKDNNKQVGTIEPSNPYAKVTVVFTIDTNGAVIKPMVQRGIGNGYDEYAQQLIKKNPHKWIPGKTKEGAVGTEVYYRINFQKEENLIVNDSGLPVK
ncbi:MAG TPA: hypothetical protein VF691_20845 [Cytophagaceae bacterium]|jgi:hypothetical protein